MSDGDRQVRERRGGFLMCGRHSRKKNAEASPQQELRAEDGEQRDDARRELEE